MKAVAENPTTNKHSKIEIENECSTNLSFSTNEPTSRIDKSAPITEKMTSTDRAPAKSGPFLTLVGRKRTKVLGRPRVVKLDTNVPKLMMETAKPTVVVVKRWAQMIQNRNPAAALTA